MNSRPYRMKKRADDVERTRRRIIEAAVRLHTTVGPASTTVSALAEEAGVTRLTVYRHFPDEEQLFIACQGHWLREHPPPDPSSWSAIADHAERAQVGLIQRYGWFASNGDDLFRVYRDADVMPTVVRQAMAQADARAAEALVHGTALRGRARRRLRAAAGHVVDFWTWRSLAIDQGLGTDEAVGTAVRFFASCLNCA